MTFEMLMVNVGLETPGSTRLGGVVHFLDVGWVQSPAAAAIEQVLMALREPLTDDNRLLSAASVVFDGPLASFGKDLSS